jgi:hypothetical protein
MRNYKVITPLFPTYAQTRAMMKAIAGCSVKSVRNMITAIQEQTGTPQNPVDWSEPDIWLKERLSGEDAKIAWQIWKTDNHVLNPRHSYGCYMFINNPLFDLMQTHEDGGWYPSEQGDSFLPGMKPHFVGWTISKVCCNYWNCWPGANRHGAPICCQNGRRSCINIPNSPPQLRQNHPLCPAV